MPVRVLDSIDYISEKFIGTPGISYILQSPIYTSIVIALFVTIVIILLFWDIDDVFSDAVRGGVYIFLFTLSVLFLHDKITISEAEAGTDKAADIFAPTVGAYDADIVDIKPTASWSTAEPIFGANSELPSRPEPVMLENSMYSKPNFI